MREKAIKTFVFSLKCNFQTISIFSFFKKTHFCAYSMLTLNWIYGKCKHGEFGKPKKVSSWKASYLNLTIPLLISSYYLHYVRPNRRVVTPRSMIKETIHKRVLVLVAVAQSISSFSPLLPWLKWSCRESETLRKLLHSGFDHAEKNFQEGIVQGYNTSG